MDEWPEEDLAELQRLAELGLPRATIAQRFGLSERELDDIAQAGRAPAAPMWMRIIENRLRVGEVTCQERWMQDIRLGKNFGGTLALLERRFKNVWGKDAPMNKPAVPEASSEDWDKELEKQLADPESGLSQFLAGLGFSRPP